jgi:hypothetical protein
VVAAHAPVVPHVVNGLPAQPGLHVAVQAVPAVLLTEQLYTPLAGLSGLVAVMAQTVGAAAADSRGSATATQPGHTDT